MAMYALNTPVLQCLLYYPEDAGGFFWHGRLLLIPSGEDDGRWLAASPDLDIEFVDTTEHYVYPLVKDQDIPVDIARQTYFFDELSAAEMDELMRQAKGQARILGFGGPPTGEGEG